MAIVRMLGYEIPKSPVVLYLGYLGYFTGETVIREDRYSFIILFFLQPAKRLLQGDGLKLNRQHEMNGKQL